MNLKRQFVWVWSGLNWLRIGYSCGLLWTRQSILKFRKKGGGGVLNDRLNNCQLSNTVSVPWSDMYIGISFYADVTTFKSNASRCRCGGQSLSVCPSVRLSAFRTAWWYNSDEASWFQGLTSSYTLQIYDFVLQIIIFKFRPLTLENYHAGSNEIYAENCPAVDICCVACGSLLVEVFCVTTDFPFAQLLGTLLFFRSWQPFTWSRNSPPFVECAFTRTRLLYLSWSRWIQSAFSRPVPLRSILISSSHLRMF